MGFLDGKKKEEMVGSVNNKAETLKTEMIKAIRENMKEAEEAEMDKGVDNKQDEEVAEEEEYADTDDVISSLKDEINEDDIEMGQVLSSAIEELGDVETEELLELGRTILHEIQGGK